MKLRFSAAGIRYSEFFDVKDSIVPGTNVTLVDEPENPHDDHAVRIEYNGIPIGYVPALTTWELPVLKGKPFLVAKVTEYELELVEQ